VTWNLKKNNRVGAWRSLVAHLHGVQGVPSSNLGAPTNTYERLRKGLWPPLWPLCEKAGFRMNIEERAAQIWPVLALAAHNRQILTYPILSSLIGVPPAGLGRLLEPIQSYCLLNELPPLSILVVSSIDGMPGSGFNAASDIPKYQQLVFSFDWLEHKPPTPEVLADAVMTRPSNGVPATATA
jgi:hypothetical protein